MTKKELIKLLSSCPDDMEVYKSYSFCNDGFHYEKEKIDEVIKCFVNNIEVIVLD